jgi:hypothetical protein
MTPQRALTERLKYDETLGLPTLIIHIKTIPTKKPLANLPRAHVFDVK